MRYAQRREDLGRQLSLAEKVMLWPTPHTSLDKGAGHRNPDKGPNLQTVALDLWPTPEGLRDAKSSGTKALLDRRMGESARGQPLVEVACHWPSPQARDADNRGADPSRVGDPARHGGWNLDDWAAAWTTPRASDGVKGGPNQSFGAGGIPLVTQAVAHSRSALKKSLSSPHGRGTGPRGPKSLREYLESRRLSLNPNFVEWLMGWPPGWTVGAPGALALASTDCGLPETAWSRWLQRQRTALSGLSWNYEPAPGAEPEPMQMDLPA